MCVYELFDTRILNKLYSKALMVEILYFGGV